MIKKMLVSTFLVLTIGGCIILLILFLSGVSPVSESFDENLEKVKQEVADISSSEVGLEESATELDSEVVKDAQSDRNNDKEERKEDVDGKDPLGDKKVDTSSESQKNEKGNSVNTPNQKESNKKFEVSKIK